MNLEELAVRLRNVSLVAIPTLLVVSMFYGQYAARHAVTPEEEFWVAFEAGSQLSPFLRVAVITAVVSSIYTWVKNSNRQGNQR